MSRNSDSDCTIVACVLLAALLYLAFKASEIFYSVIVDMWNTGNTIYQVGAISIILTFIYVVVEVMDRACSNKREIEICEKRERAYLNNKYMESQWTTEDIIGLVDYNQDRKCATCQEIPLWLQKLTKNWTKEERKAAIREWKEDPDCLDAIDIQHLKDSGWLLRCRRYRR